MARDGRPIGSAFYVATGSSAERGHPAVAYNSHRNEYLVVWEEYKSATGRSIIGHQLSATGTVNPSALELAYDDASVVNYSRSALTYAATADKYILVSRLSTPTGLALGVTGGLRPPVGTRAYLPLVGRGAP